MTDERDTPAAPVPATPARGQLTAAEKVMLAIMVAVASGVFVSMVSFQRQIGDLRVEIHQEIGTLRTDLGQRMSDLEQRMARLEAIMEVHFGTPPLPANSAGDSAAAQ